MHYSMIRLGTADSPEDLHRVIDCAVAAGLDIQPEDGSGAAGYAFSVPGPDWLRARQILSAWHIYRSGDLRVFLYSRPYASASQVPAAEHSAWLAWRKIMRRQDSLHDRGAPDPEWDSFIQERSSGVSGQKTA